ncbi:type 2 lanthipeptide synthetase LanM family protein [Thermoflavimicrobium dichotomicum]|uniref:Type 2 lantibiotic biosynthesis protein LanM n=1 Tax=Thermoflavimicrobium dichotomicum TaxID=46223 RepID=A0A1I3SMG1_9BACL|nr:type 2 lanthipeptide synthetase LanM family protein [Thermoflavimicrobium dichotomicum]SFJ59580.1 type 2 lantibiotic biosynthesis protein LanM [Thermoflavimicrobium dichotomicum]
MLKKLMQHPEQRHDYFYYLKQAAGLDLLLVLKWLTVYESGDNMINIEQRKKSFFIKERIAKEIRPDQLQQLKNDEYLQKRIHYWKNGFADSEKLFNEHLQLHNLNEEKLYQFMSDEHFDTTAPEKWFSVANELEGFYKKPNLPTLIKKIVELSPSEPIMFFNFIVPFLSIGVNQLEEKIGRMDHQGQPPLFTEKVYFELIKNLGESLIKICHRTLILQLNIARVTGMLEGDTPQERYTYFCNRLLTQPSYVQDLYNQYPVMLRLLCQQVIQWVENCADLYSRLLTDREAIANHFCNGEDLGTLTHLNTGISDAHKGGKHVAILTFSNGLKIVYKPRPLKVDVQFQQLLKWYNDLKQDGLPLYIMKVMDCGEYGWTEFIEYRGCSSEEEIERFYQRIGQQLALLYAINAIDFHNENLIAHGEHPVLVDLETLFNQYSFPTNIEATAYDVCLKMLNQSVLATNLLPAISFYNDAEGFGINIAGIGNEENQIYPKKIALVQGNQTDQMQVVRDYKTIEASHNSPTLNGERIELIKYYDQIIIGFEQGYQLLSQNKEELKKQVLLFSDIKVRQLIRPTHRYSSLLHISYHPDYLQDGLDREMLLGKLWLDVEAFPELKAVIPSEKEDMLEGDIPYFTMKPSEPHLWDSRDQCIPHYYRESCIEKVIRKIENLCQEDYEKQLQIIKLSMLALGPERTKKGQGAFVLQLDQAPAELDREELLAQAKKMADYIITKAIYGKNDGKTDISWIGIQLAGLDETKWRTGPIGLDLYDGLSGIALFYSYLYRITKEEKYKKIVEMTLIPIKKSIQEIHEAESRSIGAFSGISSYLYLYEHLSNLLDQPSLLQEIESIMPKYLSFISSDRNFDIIDGSAGAAMICINLFKRTKQEIYFDAAKRLCEHLLQKAEPQQQGIGWKIYSNQPLPGFAHGVAGIIWPLAELYTLTQDERFIQAVQQGLLYERSLYRKERKNWVIQNPDDLEQLPCAWCHGAPGVVLSRLLLKQAGYHDDFIDQEIEAGLETLIHEGFGRDHSLCHGDLGNIDILLFASEILQDEKWLQLAKAAGQVVLNEIKQEIVRCGVYKNVETYGAMTGLSGIGLGLLKLYGPDTVPSLIRLQPATHMKE